MSLVQLEIVDRVATLTLDNPAERNTMTAPMVEEIVAALEQIEADDGVGALVVTGAPPAFCAGANLGNLQSSDGPGLHVVPEVEDDMVEMHTDKLDPGMNALPDEVTAVDLWRARQDPKPTAVLCHESLQQRLIHAVDALEDVDDGVSGLEIEKRDDVRRGGTQLDE